MTTNFYLKKLKNGQSHIILKLTFSGVRYTWYSGIKIDSKFWNDKKQRVKVVQSMPESKSLNAKIDEIESYAKIKFNRLFIEGGVFEKDKLWSDLDCKFKNKNRIKIVTFEDYIDKFIEGRSNNPSYSKSSIKVYNLARKYVFIFARKNPLYRSMDFKILTRDFFKEYISFLNSPPYEFSKNYVSKLLTTFSTMLADAKEDGLYDGDAHKSKTSIVGREPSDNIYLSIDKLKRMINLDLSENRRLDKARDLFLLLAYTGQRVGDLGKIIPENVMNKNGVKILKYNQMKGRSVRSVYIPVHSVVESIWGKYENSELKPISDQKLNVYIKQVGKLLELNETFKKTITIAGRKRTIEKAEWEMIGTHTGRRSFATNAYLSNKLDVLSIMSITGHKSERDFLKYIKVTPEQHALKVADSSFFK